ncbi:MAG: hypothetical protein AB7I38_18825 [Dehalococcoidia bacterium]
MASQKYEERYGDERDVQVHHTQGCELCGQTGQHAHTQADWRELIDEVGERMQGER